MTAVLAAPKPPPASSSSSLQIRSQVLCPCGSLLGRERRLAQARGDPGIPFDLIDRVKRVGAEPEPADGHGMPRPGLELASMTGAVEHQKAGRRKSDAAAPCERQAAMRLLDKIVEI